MTDTLLWTHQTKQDASAMRLSLVHARSALKRKEATCLIMYGNDGKHPQLRHIQPAEAALCLQQPHVVCYMCGQENIEFALTSPVLHPDACTAV